MVTKNSKNHSLANRFFFQILLVCIYVILLFFLIFSKYFISADVFIVLDFLIIKKYSKLYRGSSNNFLLSNIIWNHQNIVISTKYVCHFIIFQKRIEGIKFSLFIDLLLHHWGKNFCFYQSWDHSLVFCFYIFMSQQRKHHFLKSSFCFLINNFNNRWLCFIVTDWTVLNLLFSYF